MTEDLGIRLQRLIRERRCRIKEISEATGISIKTIHEWTGSRARVPRSPEALTKLADYFGVSLDYLLAGREAEKEPPKDWETRGWVRYELFMRCLDRKC